MSDSLEFRLLKYIVAVAETSNFTRAAERLFLAQPSLSKQIRDLEEEIKFPIFDRSREGVRITLAGEMVLAYAKETLRAREELLEMARAVHLGEAPPLRLGFPCFPYSVISMACFGNGFHKLTIIAKTRWEEEPLDGDFSAM
jgi:DNA-binding transcriptional LysR family regulator